MINLTHLDENIVRKLELTSNFTAISNELPVEKEVYDKELVEFRHLKEPKMALQRTFGYPSTVSYTLDGTATYSIIDQSVVEFLCNDTGIANKNNSITGNAFQVTAWVWATYDRFLTTGVDNIRLAYRDNGSATWNVLSTTVRYVGPGCGRGSRIYTSNVQAVDYMGNAGTWSRKNMPFQKVILLIAGFGGTNKTSTSSGKRHFAVAVDSTTLTDSNVSRLAGQIFLNARVNS